MAKSKNTLTCDFEKGKAVFTYTLEDKEVIPELLEELREKMKKYSNKVSCTYSFEIKDNEIKLTVLNEEIYSSKGEADFEGLVP